jgi:hypothetical protein
MRLCTWPGKWRCAFGEWINAQIYLPGNSVRYLTEATQSTSA